MEEPSSFEDFILTEILLSKARWLGLCCACIVPGFIARKVERGHDGSLQQLRDFLKHRQAVVKDYPNRSEVWVKGVKIAEFEPKIVDHKLVLDAYVAGLRVDVGEELPPAATVSTN